MPETAQTAHQELAATQLHYPAPPPLHLQTNSRSAESSGSAEIEAAEREATESEEGGEGKEGEAAEGEPAEGEVAEGDGGGSDRDHDRDRVCDRVEGGGGGRGEGEGEGENGDGGDGDGNSNNATVHGVCKTIHEAVYGQGGSFHPQSSLVHKANTGCKGRLSMPALGDDSMKDAKVCCHAKVKI